MNKWIGLALVGMAAACGGGGSDGGDDRVDEFVGSWTAAAGSTQTLDCDNDELDSSDPLTGTQMFAAGTDADLVEPTPTEGCSAPLQWNVNGSKATLVGMPKCTDMGDGITVEATYNSFDLTLDSAGTTLTVSSTAGFKISGAITATCVAVIAGTATKGAARAVPANERMLKPFARFAVK